MKIQSVMVPGSVVTAKTAAGYLSRVAAQLLSNISTESAMVLAEIEQRIVSAGFLTWEECETIEIKAMAN